ncbi:hypothetical protein HEP_00340300 [Hepatocystis sp. ex Piliocolobus tephrosceles]|nr:hypothetical protein HEP_00340300 [Hepatocystis sp. ex Piliocolobus tephrosceles]
MMLIKIFFFLLIQIYLVSCKKPTSDGNNQGLRKKLSGNDGHNTSTTDLTGDNVDKIEDATHDINKEGEQVDAKPEDYEKTIDEGIKELEEVEKDVTEEECEEIIEKVKEEVKEDVKEDVKEETTEEETTEEETTDEEYEKITEVIKQIKKEATNEEYEKIPDEVIKELEEDSTDEEYDKIPEEVIKQLEEETTDEAYQKITEVIKQIEKEATNEEYEKIPEEVIKQLEEETTNEKNENTPKIVNKIEEEAEISEDDTNKYNNINLIDVAINASKLAHEMVKKAYRSKLMNDLKKVIIVAFKARLYQLEAETAVNWIKEKAKKNSYTEDDIKKAEDALECAKESAYYTTAIAKEVRKTVLNKINKLIDISKLNVKNIYDYIEKTKIVFDKLKAVTTEKNIEDVKKGAICIISILCIMIKRLIGAYNAAYNALVISKKSTYSKLIENAKQVYEDVNKAKTEIMNMTKGITNLSHDLLSVIITTNYEDSLNTVTGLFTFKENEKKDDDDDDSSERRLKHYHEECCDDILKKKNEDKDVDENITVEEKNDNKNESNKDNNNNTKSELIEENEVVIDYSGPAVPSNNVNQKNVNVDVRYKKNNKKENHFIVDNFDSTTQFVLKKDKYNIINLVKNYIFNFIKDPSSLKQLEENVNEYINGLQKN